MIPKTRWAQVGPDRGAIINPMLMLELESIRRRTLSSVRLPDPQTPAVRSGPRLPTYSICPTWLNYEILADSLLLSLVDNFTSVFNHFIRRCKSSVTSWGSCLEQGGYGDLKLAVASHSLCFRSHRRLCCKSMAGYSIGD